MTRKLSAPCIELISKLDLRS